MATTVLKQICRFGLVSTLCMGAAHAQLLRAYRVETTDVGKRANSMLALMSFSAVPDLTSSNLSMGASSGSAQSSSLVMSQLAGGDSISKTFPLYLEGGIAYSRYDPTFVASNGIDKRDVPLKWTSVSGSGGIGWDFKIAENLKLRPIFNFMLGEIASDITAASWFVEHKTGSDFDFLQDGHMSAYGLGGSLMLDYEDYKPDREIDVEWRYSNVQLHSFNSPIKSTASGESTSLWARWRAPTGLTALDRPVRYVLEFAHTTYLGDQGGLLGFNQLTSLGTGLELDSSKYNVIVTRTRLVFRYCFGQNVRGTSVGLAVSF
ncbi:hypothetical protein VVD49_03920 [Uliginosibacterium sp. H3]|uniref:Autotransporter domain-containing protein n=1 Tax=Uliginosibacterium silvisoli TaxID=3114758 RepID=A0ABU6K1A8_9RHOO|nr:hypothetical protein [Uliginosibacterium sp. H3]